MPTRSKQTLTLCLTLPLPHEWLGCFPGLPGKACSPPCGLTHPSWPNLTRPEQIHWQRQRQRNSAARFSSQGVAEEQIPQPGAKDYLQPLWRKVLLNCFYPEIHIYIKMTVALLSFATDVFNILKQKLKHNKTYSEKCHLY